MKQAETCLKRRLDDYKLIVTKMQQKLTTLALAAVDSIFLPQTEQLWPFTSHFMACIGFATCFIFHNIWDNPSHWLIFFRGVETTNQITIVHGCWWVYKPTNSLTGGPARPTLYDDHLWLIMNSCQLISGVYHLFMVKLGLFFYCFTNMSGLTNWFFNTVHVSKKRSTYTMGGHQSIGYLVEIISIIVWWLYFTGFLRHFITGGPDFETGFAFACVIMWL